MEETIDEYIKAAILYRLYKQGKWGGSHTDFENLKKGFSPRHLGKRGLKRLKLYCPFLQVKFGSPGQIRTAVSRYLLLGSRAWNP